MLRLRLGLFFIAAADRRAADVQRDRVMGA